MKTTLVFITMFLMFANLLAQQANISITPGLCAKHGRYKPEFQYLNNRLNVAVNLCNGVLLQIAGIDLSENKSKQLTYQISLIDENLNKTYVNKDYKGLKWVQMNKKICIKVNQKLYNTTDNQIIKVKATIYTPVNIIENKIYYE